MPEYLNRQQSKIAVGLLTAVVIWLGLTVVFVWPYGFYILGRLLVAYTAFQLAIWMPTWRYQLVVLGMIYQPLFHIPFTREIWFVVNLATIIWAVIMIRKFRGNISRR